jgi:hypothetical protein
MDLSRTKKIGTREEVYNGLALRTAGGLKREDIIEKIFNNRKIYISKKLSDKMKENFNIIRLGNPNHLKRTDKKTMVVTSQTNQTQQIKQPKILQAKKNGGKTNKIIFEKNENTEKSVYYPELKGIDLKELKADLEREENEEDLSISQKKEFSIEEMPDIDIYKLS